MKRKILQNERGIALAVAIFLIVVIGTLIAGAMFVATQDQRSGESVRRVYQSFGVAEQGALEQVRTWNNGWANLALYPSAGSTTSVTPTPIPGRGTYNGKIYHLNQAGYFVDMTGSDTVSRSSFVGKGVGARQRIGLLVRAVPSMPLVSGSYTTRSGDNSHLRGGYTVSGIDTPPPGWASCPATQPSIPGMVTDDTTDFVNGKFDLSRVTGAGTPPYRQDPTLTEARQDTIGSTGFTYDQLVAMAGITLPGGSYLPAPVTFGSTCVTTNNLNWGSPYAPTGPCGNYFPIIHITGDLVVRGNSGVTGGQGVLLIDGNVKAFDFRFDGMVIVQGSIDSTHFFRVDGAVQEKNQNERTNQDVWDVQFVYSTCALQKVFAQFPNGVSLLRSRSWAELY